MRGAADRDKTGVLESGRSGGLLPSRLVLHASVIFSMAWFLFHFYT
jgi:hypothetical protein